MSDNVKDFLFCVVLVVASFIFGARYHHVYSEPNHESDCPAEDEYIEPESGACIHVDVIVTQHTSPMIVCTDGNVYYKPEEAPC